MTALAVTDESALDAEILEPESLLVRWDGAAARYGSLPFLPDAGVASGLVWPAAGRDVLRAVASATVERAAEPASDDDGASDAVVLRAGDWRLKTSEPRRTDDDAEARSWLLALARRSSSLGDLAPREIVFAAKRDADGPFRIWTVTRWAATLRREMEDAVVAGDDDALGSALAAFADAVVASVALVARRRSMLRVSPGSFARANGAVRYVDDEATVGDALPLVGHAILRRVDEYRGRPAALQQYLTALETGLVTTLTPVEVRAVGLTAAFDAIDVASAQARLAQLRLREVVAAHSHGRSLRDRP